MGQLLSASYKDVFSEWRQELTFLSEIDKYRYNKYYMLPSICDFISIKEKDLEKRANPIASQLDQMLNKLEIMINDSEILWIKLFSFLGPSSRDLYPFFFHPILQCINKTTPNKEFSMILTSIIKTKKLKFR